MRTVKCLQFSEIKAVRRPGRNLLPFSNARHSRKQNTKIGEFLVACFIRYFQIIWSPLEYLKQPSIILFIIYHYWQFSTRMTLPSKGHLAKSGDIFWIIMIGVLGKILLVASGEKVTDTIKYPARHTTTKDMWIPEHQQCQH